MTYIMTNYKKRLGTAIATVAILANATLPVAFAGTTINITGNAADSDNDVVINNTKDTNVTQNNTANFTNKVNADASTGNNDANRNNGGNVEVTTGKASVAVAISNWANANSAKVGGNNSDGGSDVSLWVVGNAADSDNDISINKNSTTDVDQDNNADFKNKVDANADSGDNDANRNNGGDVMIDTGDAEVDVTVDNMANFNWADLNCGCTFGEGGLDVNVNGNGDSSDNNVNGDFDSNSKADQDNDAHFDTEAKYLDADTGNNDANKNNGGADSDPAITTGDGDVNAEVSNSANVNGIGGDEPEWPEFNWGGMNVSFNFDLGDLLDALGL